MESNTVFTDTDNNFSQFTETLDQILYGRFGFNLELGIGYDDEPSNEEWRKDAVLLLQDGSSSVHRMHKRSIVDFLRKLCSGAADAPSEVLSWDLSASNRSFLRKELGHGVTISKVTTASGVIYVIHTSPNKENTRWKLAVDSPSSALLCVRSLSESPSCINDVVRRFMRKGISFRTFSPRAVIVDHNSWSNTPLPPICLNIRESGYKPNATDYATYKAARESFLAHPHARAALKKGGIVWRLAVESIDPRMILSSPSESALNHGLTIHAPSGRKYYDDDLTDDELDLICGVYHAHTGE
jgi:hypothetical protein